MTVWPLMVVMKFPSLHVSCTQNPATFLWIMVSTNFSNLSSPPNPLTFWDNNLHSNGQVSLGLVLIFFSWIACPTRPVPQFWVIVELAAPYSKSLNSPRSSSSVRAVGGGLQGANLGVCLRCHRWPSRCKNHADVDLLQNTIIGGIRSRCLRRIVYRTILQVWLNSNNKRSWWRPAWRKCRGDGFSAPILSPRGEMRIWINALDGGSVASLLVLVSILQRWALEGASGSVV